jgi:hypothetical protein
LAPHDEAQGFSGQGKCGGCATKAHVLIRGDLFGESAGDGGARRTRRVCWLNKAQAREAAASLTRANVAATHIAVSERAFE